MRHNLVYNRQKDPFFYGFIAGLLGTLADEVVHWWAVYAGFARTTTGHYLSQLMFPHQEVILSKLLLGEFTHNIAGGILGIFLAFIFYLFGYRFALFKGIGLGIALWIVHVAIIPNLISPRPYIFRTFNESLIDMAAHFMWGLVAAFFLLKTTATILPEPKPNTAITAKTLRLNKKTKRIRTLWPFWPFNKKRRN